MNQLAVSWRAQGRYDEADRAYREALTVYEAANGPDDPKVAVALSNLGDILRRRGASMRPSRSIAGPRASPKAPETTSFWPSAGPIWAGICG